LETNTKSAETCLLSRILQVPGDTPHSGLYGKAPIKRGASCASSIKIG